jgi:4-amino-4-deoxy-L-arabinose transferase-like glycosyltransferase
MATARTYPDPGCMQQHPASAELSMRPAIWKLRLQLTTLLCVHVLVWTWVGWASRTNLDQAGDMAEAYVWAQGWQWGHHKHPPLSAWMVGLWFAVVPESLLTYSLLSALNSAVGLAGLALLAGEWLPRRWVLVAVALAALAPAYTSLAMRFNANAVLLSTWPFATALFVRLMRRGRWSDGLACGLACALAMLGKYYSAVLLASFLAVALAQPNWRSRLADGPALLALACCALCLAPHAAWLLAQSQGPWHYAQAAVGMQGFVPSLGRALNFAGVMSMVPSLAWALLWPAFTGSAARPVFAAAATAPFRPTADAVWWLAMLPIAFTVLATVVTGARTASTWGIGLAASLACLSATRAHAAVGAFSLPRLWCCLGAVWALAAILAPVWWHNRAAVQAPAVTLPRAELAQALSALWQREHGSPLPWIAGTRVLAASTSFHAPSHPRYWSLFGPEVETPWVELDQVRRRGGLIVCDAADSACSALAAAWSNERRWLEVAKTQRGHRFRSVGYDVWHLRPTGPATEAADYAKP